MPINGRVRVAGSVLVELADDMALGPPIQWILFFVVGVIGLGPLINLLDGLPLRWRGFYCFLFLWRHFCGDNFLG